MPSIECEPDFYKLARMYPLPDRRTKSQGLPSAREKPEESANLARLKYEDKQPARKNETVECSRSPPTALSNARPDQSGVLEHLRDISTTQSKKTNRLEQAKADADIAFARGYVPDYQVLVNSFPTAEERATAQMQAQMRSATSQEGMLMRPPTLLVGAPQPVSAIPGNMLVDIHGRAMEFWDVNYFRGIPPPAMQQHHLVMQQRIQGMPPIIHRFEGASSSREIQRETAPQTATSDDGSTPHHVKMHQEHYKGSDKMKPIHIPNTAAFEVANRLELSFLAGKLPR